MCAFAAHPTPAAIGTKCLLDLKEWIADNRSCYRECEQHFLAIGIILVTEKTTAYRMNKSESSLRDLCMPPQRPALLGCQLHMS
jgi:hypothetical protein